MQKPRTPLRIRVGYAIRLRREALGYSQEGFAEQLDVHRTYYSTVERGLKNLQLDTLERICERLGARPCEILEEAEKDPPKILKKKAIAKAASRSDT